MTEQLALLDLGPKLSPKQAYALEQLQHAAHDGLSSDELGATLHAWRNVHSSDDRCKWCGKEGRHMALALAEKGLARYRGRLKVWQATGLPDTPPAQEHASASDWDGTGPVPYNAFPVGY